MDISVSYPAWYRDKNGEETTTIHNDGVSLSMTVRGVRFLGTDFDDFEPVDPAADLASFTLAGYHRGDRKTLCDCVISLRMALPVSLRGQTQDCPMDVRFVLGPPDEVRGGIESENLSLALVSPWGEVRSRGDSGWFEDELLDIQRQLPESTHLKACINCAFSDYSPSGHGLFGGLACFRDNKDGYLAVRTKGDLFKVWDTMTEFVQETYLCPDFQRRKPGTGYRG